MSRFDILKARACTALADWFDAAQERVYADSFEPGAPAPGRTGLRARVVALLLRPFRR